MPAEAKTPPRHPVEGHLEEITVTHNYTLGRPGHFRFTPDGRTLLFSRADGADARSDLWAKDVASGEERRLLSAEDLLAGGSERLSAQEKAVRERQRIKTKGFTGFSLSRDGRFVFVKLSGKLWRYDLEAGQASRVAVPKGVVMDPRPSPDGKRLAFVRDHNLYVMRMRAPAKAKSGEEEVVAGRIRALTKGGDAARPFGLAEFVAQEEMSRYHGYWWSPDSRQIAFQATDNRALEQFTIADASAPEKSAQTFPYPRPGKANAVVRLFVIGVDGRDKIEVEWDKRSHPYLARVVWSKRAPLSILVQSRDQQEQAFLRVDMDTGATVPMLLETDEAWLNLSNTTPRWLSDGKSYLWATESSGGWALERHHPRLRSHKGGLKAREVILEAQAGFRRLVHVDEAQKQIWFLGGPDPVQTHLYRVALEGGEPEQISPEGGEHTAAFSRTGAQFVLTRSTFQRGAVSVVHQTDGLATPVPAPEGPAANEVGRVGREPKIVPNLERVAPEQAGGFNALIIRPRDFDANKKYPVILYVYGGPHHNVVQADVSRYHLHQWMADHGFVVVCLDGRGTQHRGREFERAIREKFGDVPLDDQVAGLTALGASHPELDLDRVGVYGWSFGGYLAALAVLRRPDVFKVAVAGAPVVDWTYYDTHYTERYLGLPEQAPDAYKSGSLLTYAKDLSRPLMLVHGVADDNVYFAHTLQLADALFRAKKPFDLVPLVGLTHQVADPKMRSALYDRMVNFLGEQLW